MADYRSLGTALGAGVGSVALPGLGTALGGGLGYGAGVLANSLSGGGSAPSPEHQAMIDYENKLKLQQQQAFQQQQQLAETLRLTSMGLGPSVAGAQLGQGLEQINREQGSQAAGVGGEGGVLARYEAMNNAATGGAAENQSAALARATETANAQQNLGNVLGAENTGATSAYGVNVNGINAGNANSIAEKKNDEDFQTKLLGAGLSGYSQYKAAGASGGP